MLSSFGDHMSIKTWATWSDCRRHQWEPADILKRHGRMGEKTVCTKDDWKGDMKTASRKKKKRSGHLFAVSTVRNVPDWNIQACRNLIIRCLWGHIRSLSDKCTCIDPTKGWTRVTLAIPFTPVFCDFQLKISTSMVQDCLTQDMQTSDATLDMHLFTCS